LSPTTSRTNPTSGSSLGGVALEVGGQRQGARIVLQQAGARLEAVQHKVALLEPVLVAVAYVCVGGVFR